MKVERNSGYDEKLARKILKTLATVYPEGMELPQEIKTHHSYVSTMYVLLQDNLIEGLTVSKTLSGRLQMISGPTTITITWRGREKLKPDWNKRLSLIFLGLTACATVVTAFTQCSSTFARQYTSELPSYKTEQMSMEENPAGLAQHGGSDGVRPP